MNDPTVEAHFVTFYSPGTFFPETREKPIALWDVDEAVKMARTITERYNARPYGFQFSTRARGPKDLDSHATKRSGIYYLGGRVETLADVERRNDPKEKILLANMRGNGIEKIIINENSWRFTGELHENDIVLDVTLGEPTT